MDDTNILIGVLSSVVSSFVFLFLMFMMRPKLIISELIAKTVIDGRTAFVIKIVNPSWWRLYDIHAELVHIKLENASGGQNVHLKRMRLVNCHLWSINSVHSWRADINAEYAALYVCLEDLEVLWTNDTMIEFRIIAKYSFSGFSRVMRRRFYRSQSSIREGAFKFGNSLEID